MPENSNFPYRRYDRLPPIHQFSIESDTDLSETAELIEEYDVFDPTRPRPKIILVIGMRTESKILILLLTLLMCLHFKKSGLLCEFAITELNNDKQRQKLKRQ